MNLTVRPTHARIQGQSTIQVWWSFTRGGAVWGGSLTVRSNPSVKYRHKNNNPAALFPPRYLSRSVWIKPVCFPFQAEPIRVVVTGAAGQIAYSLLYSIAKGDVFGKDQVRLSLESWLHNLQQQSPLKQITAQTAGRCTVLGSTVS